MSMHIKSNTLDVRPDFRAGRSPCDRIKSALAAVRDGETLRLLVPFEPVPIYEVARNQGLGHESRQTPDGDWEVLFQRTSRLHDQSPAPSDAGSAACGCGCVTAETSEFLDLDARNLEPPQPMVKILEALIALPAGVGLRARTDRRPAHLYSLLEARGFSSETREQTDGSFVTHIRRP